MVACYESALRLQPEHAGYHSNLGATLVDRGSLDAAIGHLPPRSGFVPTSRPRTTTWATHSGLPVRRPRPWSTSAGPCSLHEVARVTQQPGRAFDRPGGTGGSPLALSRGDPARPDFPAAHNNLGNALHALGRLEEAESCFREAIRLHSGFASAHAGLAGVLEESGDLEQSEQELRAAIRFDPMHAGALARLASRLRNALPEADRAAVEARLADASLPTQDRATLLFGLVQVLDANGEFDRAAGLADEANALLRADFPKRGMGYDPKRHSAHVDRLIDVFTPAFFDRVRGFGLETERPVFIVGMPRSGTTLAEQILASHPRVFGAGELSLVQQIFGQLPGTVGRKAAPLDCIADLDRATVQELARRHLETLEAMSPSADRIVDKMPENALFLGWIVALFPRATLIHCRRDPRDVALSCWLTHFGNLRWACDASFIAARINDHLRLMDHWRRSPAGAASRDRLRGDHRRSGERLATACGLVRP